MIKRIAAAMMLCASTLIADVPTPGPPPKALRDYGPGIALSAAGIAGIIILSVRRRRKSLRPPGDAPS